MAKAELIGEVRRPRLGPQTHEQAVKIAGCQKAPESFNEMAPHRGIGQAQHTPLMMLQRSIDPGVLGIAAAEVALSGHVLAVHFIVKTDVSHFFGQQGPALVEQ